MTKAIALLLGFIVGIVAIVQIAMALLFPDWMTPE